MQITNCINLDHTSIPNTPTYCDLTLFLCLFSFTSSRPFFFLTKYLQNLDYIIISHAIAGGFSPAIATALYINFGINYAGLVYVVFGSVSVLGLYINYCFGQGDKESDTGVTDNNNKPSSSSSASSSPDNSNKSVVEMQQTATNTTTSSSSSPSSSTTTTKQSDTTSFKNIV